MTRRTESGRGIKSVPSFSSAGGRTGRSIRRIVGVCMGAAVLVGSTATALAGDSPSGYYYATDSNAPTASGSSLPYTEPTVGGTYGSYLGEVMTWTDWQGCTSGVAFSNTNEFDSNANHNAYGTPGSAAYDYAAGPGVDPNYNGTTTEAYNWGWNQAAATYQQIVNDAKVYSDGFPLPIVFMDIEKSSVSGGTNGWNNVGANCGTSITSAGIAYAVDRATVNGFINYLADNNTGFVAGLYSAPSMWNYTFGTGSYGSVPYTWQWTYESSSTSVTPGPSGFCQSGYGCAQWFGGVSSSYQAVWQWTQSAGDYAQMHASVFPAGW